MFTPAHTVSWGVGHEILRSVSVISLVFITQEMIENYVHWNEDIGEWQLKCVAYTGNNMRKQSPLPEKSKVTLLCRL